jgi:hypothetical protein
MYTHFLLFGRDKGSPINDIDVEMIRSFWNDFSPLRRIPQLSDFPIYGSRLRYIQQRMENWRPEKIKELAIRGYGDPINYYLFWWSVLIGFVTIFTLGCTIAITYAALIQPK